MHCMSGFLCAGLLSARLHPFKFDLDFHFHFCLQP